MPGQFFTNAERERLERFPSEVAPADLITFFTLSESDFAQIPVKAAPQNRLGFALQLCALRYLGFAPDDLSQTPTGVVQHVAGQLRVPPGSLSLYGNRPHTRTDHLQAIICYLGFRKATPADLEVMEKWLIERALEHDKPTLLFQLAREKLLREKILRPGVTSLERLVVAVRQAAENETYRRLEPMLVESRRALLDTVSAVDEARGRTLLAWLQQGTTSNSPKAILGTLEKLNFLKGHRVGDWDLAALTPNRRKFLAQLARRSTNQALQRMSPERRYPILAAFLQQSAVDITDELVDMLDRCLAQAYARAGRDLDEFRSSVARETNEKLRLFQEMARVVLDSKISDAELRPAIFQRIPEIALQSALDRTNRITRPLDDHYFDFLAGRYGYLRQFTPAFLEAFTFRSHLKEDPLLAALAFIRTMNTNGQRNLPEDAPLDFVPSKWKPYVGDNQNTNERRRYYELCALFELRAALRSGDVWLEHSRRYADPETYLIPRGRWPEVRSEVCKQIAISENSVRRLEERESELREMFPRVDALLAQSGKVRIESGELVVSPLEAEALPETAVELAALMDERLPRVDLSQLLVEVDGWTEFSRCLEPCGRRRTTLAESPAPPLRLHSRARLQRWPRSHGPNR